MAVEIVKQKRAYFYAAAVVLFWSTIASAFKLTLRHIDILPLLFFASLVSTLVLAFYLLIAKKLALLKAFSGKDYVRSALLGFLSPFLYYVVLIRAYNILTAQEALTLNFVWPIMLILFSIPLLGQKIRLKDVLAICVSFFGVFIIATRGNIFGFRFTNPVGVLLALVSTVIWAMYWIYNLRDDRDETVRLFLNFAFGTIYIFAALLILTRPQWPAPQGLVGAAYIGLFEMGLTFLLWLRALRLSETAAHVAGLVYLVPFLSLVVISLVLHEKILISTVVGLFFIIGGIIRQKF